VRSFSSFGKGEKVFFLLKKPSPFDKEIFLLFKDASHRDSFNIWDECNFAIGFRVPAFSFPGSLFGGKVETKIHSCIFSAASFAEGAEEIPGVLFYFP
jgi:hypothetical protein